MTEKSHLDYLQKTFLEELNYKIWVTKGARFNASTRLNRTGRLSNLAVNMISVYLTAAGLLSVYNIGSNVIDDKLLAYIITSLSIVALVFGQIESSKEFAVKAKEYHSCALELSALYNELRIFKTLEIKPSDQQKIDFARSIASKYQIILERYENHHPIDNNIFKANKAKYHKLKWHQTLLYRISYYLRSYLIYHLLMLVPIALITFIIYYRK